MFFCVLAGYDVSAVCRYHSELLQSVFAIDGFSRHGHAAGVANIEPRSAFGAIGFEIVAVEVEHDISVDFHGASAVVGDWAVDAIDEHDASIAGGRPFDVWEIVGDSILAIEHAAFSIAVNAIGVPQSCVAEVEKHIDGRDAHVVDGIASGKKQQACRQNAYFFQQSIHGLSVDCCKIRLISSSSSGVNAVLRSAPMLSSSCSIVRGPMMTDVTDWFAKSQAVAI